MMAAAGRWWVPVEEPQKNVDELTKRLGKAPRVVKVVAQQHRVRLLLLVMWVLFAGVPAIGIFGIYQKRSIQLRLYRSGQVVSAKALKKFSEPLKKETLYGVVYRFEVDGKSYTDRWYRPFDAWQGVDISRPLQVTYIPSDPRINAVGALLGKKPPPLDARVWFGILFGLAVASAVTITFFGKEWSLRFSRRVLGSWPVETKDGQAVFVGPKGERYPLTRLQPLAVLSEPVPAESPPD
jgi:hypothetical protein